MSNPAVHVAITMDDGSLAVLAFMTQGRSPTLPWGAVWSDQAAGHWDRPATDANLLAEITKAFPAVDQLGRPKPQPVRYKIVGAADLPQDRTYRNAWTHDGDKFDHDMARARQLHLDRVRKYRALELDRLDRAWMKANGQGDAKAAKDIETQRQTLRDAPAMLPVEQAATIDQLKALWPDNLPR